MRKARTGRDVRTDGLTDVVVPPSDISPVRYAHEDKGALEKCGADRHGTTYAFRSFGCRCADARRAVADEKAKQRRRMYLHGPQLIDRTGTIRRVQGLMFMGWSAREVAARAGYANQSELMEAWRLIGKPAAARVAAVYDDLAMTPGPSVRVRLLARRRGYVSPLAWDEDTIDDPAAKPAGAAPERRVYTTRRDVDIAELLASGERQTVVAAMYGITKQRVAQIASEPVDEVAVRRRMEGDASVSLTLAERRHALRSAYGKGWSDRQIAEGLGITMRSVGRIRAGLGLKANRDVAGNPVGAMETRPGSILSDFGPCKVSPVDGIQETA